MAIAICERFVWPTKSGKYQERKRVTARDRVSCGNFHQRQPMYPRTNSPSPPIHMSTPPKKMTFALWWIICQLRRLFLASTEDTDLLVALDPPVPPHSINCMTMGIRLISKPMMALHHQRSASALLNRRAWTDSGVGFANNFCSGCLSPAGSATLGCKYSLSNSSEEMVTLPVALVWICCRTSEAPFEYSAFMG